MRARLIHRFDYRYTEPVTGFPSLQVTDGEVVALLVAQKALEQYRGTRFEEVLRSAFAKLTASMGDESVFSPDAEVSFRPVGVSTHDLAVFETLHTAVRRRREVRFAYRKPRSAADEERRVRTAAACSLAFHGSERAMPHLAAALKRSAGFVNGTAGRVGVGL